MKKTPTLLCLLTAAAALPFLAVPATAPAALDDLKPRRAANAPDVSADRAALLEGVSVIGAPGSPGGVTPFGPGAFAVVGGEDGKTALAPVVAAARFEKGRIVAFGHGGYFESFADKDTGKLLINAVRWTAGDAKPGKRPRVAVVGREKLVTWLNEKDNKAEAVSGSWERQLGGADVLIMDSGDLKKDQVEAVLRFVKNGGGLLTAATGWGWEQIHKGKDIAVDFPGNDLLGPAGLVFNNTMPGTTAKDGFTVAADPLALGDASRALDALTTGKPDEKSLPQISATLGLAIRSVPPGDKLFRPRLAELQKKSGPGAYPTVKKPLTQANALARLLFTQEVETLHAAPPDKTPAHPAGDEFPGKVPANAPKVTKKLSIDTAVPGWHSTGLYAAPGQEVKVECPAAAANDGYSVRIGCHSDSIWHKEKWHRSPVLSRRFPVTAKTTGVANAFGGLVYIEVPDKKSGAMEFVISGAVEAPLFVLGRTTDEEWKTLRKAPGPWAELACDSVILSVPSESIRRLSNPTELMQFWDDCVKAEDTLASTDRKRPERIVADAEISAGYMHSGYPIMTYLDVVPMVSDVQAMRRGSWGHFHELGHNHQEGDWTPDGTGEVTCNIFTLYVYDKVCGIPVEKAREGFTKQEIRKNAAAHLAAGGTLEHWKSDPFLALTIYVQLQQEFGWEPFQKVFAEYKTLASAERPKTDAEKHGQFMARFSKAVGKNLAPFFLAWGLPIPDALAVEVKALPEWMPKDWPK